jgi:NAD(P)-dependent dehydrogenase (short-subunit alcohol dehydrogenase family)
MREQGSGAIVNCSSLGGLVGLPQRAAYHGTTHAVLGMTKSAGVEYAPRGIRINAVCPGTIDTPMVADMLEGQAEAMAEIMKQQSIGRLGRAEEVAAAVLWLCSPAASLVIGVGLSDRRRPHRPLTIAMSVQRSVPSDAARPPQSRPDQASPRRSSTCLA